MPLKISQNWQENSCAIVSLLIKFQAEACNFIKKETLAQVFSCEFCEMFENIFLTEQLQVRASKNDRYSVESNDFFLCFQIKRFLLKKVLLILAVSMIYASRIHNLLRVKKISLKARPRFVTELARFERTFPWKHEKKQPTENLCVVLPTPEQKDLIEKLIDSRKAMTKSERQTLQFCHILNNQTGMWLLLWEQHQFSFECLSD